MSLSHLNRGFSVLIYCYLRSIDLIGVNQKTFVVKKYDRSFYPNWQAARLTFGDLRTSADTTTGSRTVVNVGLRLEDDGHAWLTKTIGINGQSHVYVYPCYIARECIRNFFHHPRHFSSRDPSTTIIRFLTVYRCSPSGENVIIVVVISFCN